MNRSNPNIKFDDSKVAGRHAVLRRKHDKQRGEQRHPHQILGAIAPDAAPSAEVDQAGQPIDPPEPEQLHDAKPAYPLPPVSEILPTALPAELSYDEAAKVAQSAFHPAYVPGPPRPPAAPEPVVYGADLAPTSPSEITVDMPVAHADANILPDPPSHQPEEIDYDTTGFKQAESYNDVPEAAASPETVLATEVYVANPFAATNDPYNPKPQVPQPDLPAAPVPPAVQAQPASISQSVRPKKDRLGVTILSLVILMIVLQIVLIVLAFTLKK